MGFELLTELFEEGLARSFQPTGRRDGSNELGGLDGSSRRGIKSEKARSARQLSAFKCAGSPKKSA